MENYYDYKKFAILYVDDEEIARKNFARLFEDRFRILTAGNAQEGLATLQEKHSEIGLLLTDQRMPGEKGVWLLEKARQLQPRIIRILVTAYADMEAAIAAVNTGSIYKYISKPWSEPDMENALRRGLEFFLVQRERDQLLHEKLSVLHNMMIADRIVSLGLLAQGLSHHIRNPLTAVKTFLDLAPAKLAEEKSEVEGIRDPEFWKEHYQLAQGQIGRINNLLTELWTASDKPEENFADMVDLRIVLQETIETQRTVLTAKHINVDTAQVPSDLPKIRVDKAKIYRLFELLVKDECVSLPQHSRITISARAERNTNGRQEVELRLMDNGPGLRKEALRLIFDPFSVRSDTPTEYGIHLMTCFFIVHHHGGRIEATTNGPDGGTAFTIHLPCDPSAVPPRDTEERFFERVVMSDSIWERLMTSV